MSPLLVLAVTVILIILLVYVGFWIIAKMGLPEPANLIARIVVGVIALLLLVGLFVPGLGVGLQLGGH